MDVSFHDQDIWMPDTCLVNEGYPINDENNYDAKRNGNGGIFLRPTLQLQWALHVYENGTVLNVQR